jgi:hypothetical protein
VRGGVSIAELLLFGGEPLVIMGKNGCYAQIKLGKKSIGVMK